MTWRKNTAEEIEEIRQFVEGMKRGQTLATSDSLLETLRQIHDRREAPVVGHDHKHLLRERLRRQMRVEDASDEDAVYMPVFTAPPVRRRALHWAVAASIAVHVGMGAILLPQIEFSQRLVERVFAGNEQPIVIWVPKLEPLVVPEPPAAQAARPAPAADPAKERPAGLDGSGGAAAPAAEMRVPTPPTIPVTAPAGPPVAPGVRPVVSDYSTGLEDRADRNLPETTDNAPPGPPAREEIRASVDVASVSIERTYDVGPKLHNRPRPMYPTKALEHQVSGVVTLSVIFSADGSVRDVQVVKGLGYGLDEAAAAAVRRWKFTPAMKNGVPVSVRSKVEVSFELR